MKTNNGTSPNQLTKNFRKHSGKLLLLMTLMVGVNAPQNANAGICLSLAFFSGGSVGILIAGGSSLAGGLVSREVLDGKDQNDTLGAIGILLIILDADGALPASQIQQTLQTQYKHIDNPGVFLALSETIKAKADQMPFTNGQKMIRISRQEFDQSLSSIDVTGDETEIEQMAKDLE
jgi:hypothetical protein